MLQPPKPLDPNDPFAALEATQSEEARLRQDLMGAGTFGTPESVAEAFGAAHKAGTSPVEMLDPATRKLYEKTSQLSGVPMERLVGSRTAKWAFQDPLTVDMVGGKFDPMLTMEDRAKAAEAARVDAENAKTGRSALAGIMASISSGTNNLLAMPAAIQEAIWFAAKPSNISAAEWGAGLDAQRKYEPLTQVSLLGRSNAAWVEPRKRATESALVRDPLTGQEVINWGAVDPSSLHGLENITNMVAGEAVPMLAQYLLAAALAPETGGASLAGVTVANAGKLSKLGRFGKAVWSYAKSPVSIINAGRVIQGQADEGVRGFMAQGMTEDEAWAKVAPGALLAGLFSAAAGGPMEAKIMEDLFTKAAKAPGAHGFVTKAATRLKAFASQGFKEGAQEVLEGLGEDLAAYITYQPDKTVKEWAANALMNFVGGAATGGPLGAITQGSRSIQHAENAAFIQALHDEKARTEFAKAAPEKFAEFVHQLTEGGNLENLAVDAKGFETYYQSIGQDPKAFAVEALGVRSEDYDVAVGNGGDLIIPTSQYALHIAGTDNFAPIYNVTRVEQGGPTIGELHTTHTNEARVAEAQRAMKALPATDPERDVLRDKIAAMLVQSTRVFGANEVLEIADSYAKVLTVTANRAKTTPTELFEKNKLNITRDFHAKLETQRGADHAFTGPDRSAEAAQVQGAPAGRVTEGLRPGARRGNGGLRGEGPGGQEAAAGRFGFARGVAAPPMLWHGTETKGIPALKAEGLGAAAPGSMGPGLHVTAGPQVAAQYSGGNPDGMFRVGLRQNYTPFDASTEKSYTVDEAAQLGITTDREMTGAEIWAYASAELGMDGAVALLKGHGFDGLYYDHGGEDAWSVWSDQHIVGSKLTDMPTAEADYARQGSRRDELTGQLKVAQMRLNQLEQVESVRSHLRNARRIIQNLGKNTFAEFKAELGWAPKKIKAFEFMGETGDKALRGLFSVAQTKEMSGAPPTIRTEADRQALVEKWREMALVGEPGRFWYDDSANAFLQLGGSELQAFKLATLTALYSPQTSVADNGRRAILAYYDAMHNMAVSAGGVHPNVKELAQRVMSATSMEGVAEVMSGQKTSAFQQNLIDLFAPAHADQDVATIDIHMMRAAGFEKDAPTATQYAWVETLTREVAAELGWRPKEAQAAIWVAQKMLTDKKGKGSDVSQAGFHYGDAALKIAASVNVEAMPGADQLTGIFPGIANATRAQLEEYHAEKMQIVRSVLKGMGVMVADDVVGHGYWDGVSNPVTSFKVPMPHIGKEDDHTLAPSAVAEINRAAQIVLATVNDQDAIGWMKPFYSTSVGDANGMHYALDRELTYEEMVKLGDTFSKAGFDAYIDASDPKNIKVVNYGWDGVLQGTTGAAAGKAAKAYHTQLHTVILSALPANVKASADLFAASSGLIERGTTDGITREGNGLSAPGAPAADHGRIFAGREQIAQLNERYRTEFGWGAEPSRGERPVFAERSGGPNALSVNGVHFGTTPGLTALDPARYSTFAGREGQRLRMLPKGDPLLRRVYFYEQPTEDMPEKEAVVKGTNPYEVALTNVYDLAADLDGIVAENRGDGNGIERAIIAAGYDGYITPAPGIPGRAIVLLGTKEVPVREARSEPSLDGVVRLEQSVTDNKGSLPTTQYVTTELIKEADRPLGVKKILSEADAAAAFAYLGTSPMERFDAIITNKAGKPIAVVGGFKGGIDYTLADLDTILSSAFRVEGAAGIWFGHNHPSGSPGLSNQDLALNAKLSNLFSGSAIKPHGILAIGSSSTGVYDFEHNTGAAGTVSPDKFTKTPLVERVFSRKISDNSNYITSPRALKDWYANSDAFGKTGVLLLDTKSKPSAFVELTDEQAARLRTTGVMDELYRASSVSPHKSVIIIDPSGSFSNDSVENLQKFYEASGHPVVDLLRGNESQRYSGGFKPLGENESRMFRQGPRGFLEFPSTRNGQPRTFNLVLLESENKSTVFHELGHFYLELLGDVAADPQADESVRKDYDTILQWFGVTDRSQITREMHEKFADAHLVYLQEGKAPTEELHSPFRKFSKWLSKIGQQLLGVEVNMTDEVRGVFDRLYASDAEIEEAKSQVTTRMFTTAEQAGMSAAEFEVYSKAIAKEAEVAKERLMARLIKELEREQKAEYREALEKMRTEVEADVMARPEYAALKALSDGVLADGETPVKLSRQALVEKYGKDLPKQLTRDANYVYTTEGGMDADAAAMLLGFESGDALVQALTNLEPRKAIIDRLTKNAMEENYPTLLGNPEQLRETAVSMLNGSMRGNILATELRILKRKQAQTKPIVKQALQVQAEQTQEEARTQAAQAKAEAQLKAAQEREGIREASMTSKVQSMREAAKRHISGLSAWKIRPIVFLRMQQKAAKTSYTAALKNDYATAVAAKEQEMSAHFLYLEAVKAKDEAESFRDFVKRNDSATVRGKMGKAGGTFLAQFDALRDRFEIERLPNKELARRENLGEWARKQEENAGDVVVAEWIVLEEFGGPRNYKELTMAELRDVRNALTNIKHLAYKELGEIIDGKRVEYEQMFEEFEQAFAANLPDRKPLMRASDKRRDKTSHKAGAMLQGLDATMVKIEALINWIDGNNVKGPAHRYIWNRIVAAQNEDYKLTLEFNQHLLEALGKMPKEQREGLSTETFDGVMQDPVTRGEILTMLLYSGQETRRRKLLEGYAPYGLTEQSLQLAFSHLTAEDFKFAADVWATFDKLSPKILDLEERLTGIRPDWEKGRAFEVYGRDGELLAQLGGGYFPLVADPVLNGELAKKQEGGTVQQIMTGNGYSRAATSTGHTKELTGKTYPLLLDFQRILTSELTNQIKDLTHREAVLSINKILSNERFQRLVKEHIGEGYEQQLTPWLTNIASDRNAGSSQGLGAVNALMMKARANTVAAVLGFKFSSMIVQLSDIVRVVAPGDFRVDVTHLAGAYAKLAPGAPGRKATIEMIKTLSPEMAQRSENLDRDLRARLDQLRGDESLTAGWNRAAFSGLAMMDKLVSWPTWLGAYQQAMATHGDQDQAVMEADRTVRMRLMTGAPKDLTPIQANKHWSYKAITMFMGDATNNYNMLRNAGHNINGMKGVPTFTAALMVVMLANILGDWLKGQMPEDPEEKAKWAARKALLAPMGTVPVVRDLASSFDNLLAGKPFTDYKFSPAFTAVQKVFIDPAIHTKRLANGSEEFSDYVINMGESAGYAFGVGGTSQAAASTRYFKRFVEGKERPDNALEFTEDLVRGKRKGQK